MMRNVRKQCQVDFEASLVPRCFLGFPAIVVGFPCPFAFLRIPMILASRLPQKISRSARVRCSFEAITDEQRKFIVTKCPVVGAERGEVTTK